MTKEEVQQRIRYLVEFGGLYEDPIEDVLRRQKRIAALAAVGVAIVAVDLLVTLLQ